MSAAAYVPCTNCDGEGILGPNIAEDRCKRCDGTGCEPEGPPRTDVTNDHIERMAKVSQLPAFAAARIGASLDARIADLEKQNGDLRAALRNGFLLVNRPAEAFLAADPWSRNVCAVLGVEGVQGFAHVVRPKAKP